ncbi:hypothetical protein P8452_09081 [Trifolium repens]|nr:hypothetical protein P8452_09081 [Trifolium repens]
MLCSGGQGVSVRIRRSCGLGVAVVSLFAGVAVVAGGSGVAVVAGGFCAVVVIWRTCSVLAFRFFGGGESCGGDGGVRIWRCRGLVSVMIGGAVVRWWWLVVMRLRLMSRIDFL